MSLFAHSALYRSIGVRLFARLRIVSDTLNYVACVGAAKHKRQHSLRITLLATGSPQRERVQRADLARPIPLSAALVDQGRALPVLLALLGHRKLSPRYIEKRELASVVVSFLRKLHPLRGAPSS